MLIATETISGVRQREWSDSEGDINHVRIGTIITVLLTQNHLEKDIISPCQPMDVRRK